jgi:hypothetical protein
VCIKLKCNKRHTYGLNSDLGIEKVVREKKQKQSHRGSGTKTTTRVEPESPVNESPYGLKPLFYLFNVLLFLIEN